MRRHQSDAKNVAFQALIESRIWAIRHGSPG